MYPPIAQEHWPLKEMAFLHYLSGLALAPMLEERFEYVLKSGKIKIANIDKLNTPIIAITTHFDITT